MSNEPDKTTVRANETLARRLIGQYLDERLDNARTRTPLGTPEPTDAAELAWVKWWSAGELDGATASRVLIWATDRARQASRVGSDVSYRLVRAQQERHAVIRWLAERGYDVTRFSGPRPSPSRSAPSGRNRPSVRS